MSRLGAICRSLYLESPEYTTGFQQCLTEALTRIPVYHRGLPNQKLLEYLGCPRSTRVYIYQETGRRLLLHLRTEIFLDALEQMSKDWLPSVKRITEVPRSILGCMMASRRPITDVFPNIENNDRFVRGLFWLDSFALGNLLIYQSLSTTESSASFVFDPFFTAARSIELQKKLNLLAQNVMDDMGFDTKDSDVQSVRTDNSERLLEGLSRSIYMPEEPIMLCASKQLDSYMLSAALYATISDAHSALLHFLGKELGVGLEEPTCQRGCWRIPKTGRHHWTFPQPGASIGNGHHIQYGGIPQDLRWAETISYYNLTIGCPTPEALYKRVVDLLNGVRRERTAYNGKGRVSIPLKAKHNFLSSCVFCSLVKTLHRAVIDFVHGEANSFQQITMDFASAAGSDARRIPPTRKQLYLVGIRLGQAIEHFRDIKLSVKYHWRMMLSETWSSQDMTILFGIDRDSRFLCPVPQSEPNWPVSAMTSMIRNQRPSRKEQRIRPFDADDSPLRISGNGLSLHSSLGVLGSPQSCTGDLDTPTPMRVEPPISPSPIPQHHPMQPDDDVFVLKIEQVADVRFTVGILNALLERNNIHCRPLLYTVSKSGRNTMLIVPKKISSVLTCGIVPYLGTFRYARQSILLWIKPDPRQPTIRFSCNQTFAHLQILRNFYSGENELIYFAVKWIGRMLFNTRHDHRHNECIYRNSASFDRYQSLPNLLLIFGEAELLSMLSDPYAYAKMWTMEQGRRTMRRRTRRLPPVFYPVGASNDNEDFLPEPEEAPELEEDAPPGGASNYLAVLHNTSDFDMRPSESRPGSIENFIWRSAFLKAQPPNEIIKAMEAAKAVQEKMQYFANYDDEPDDDDGPSEQQHDPMDEEEKKPPDTPDTPDTPHKLGTMETVFFAPTKYSFYTAMHAYLNPIGADILVTSDAMRAIWFTLRRDRSLWARYHLLAGVICELRVPPIYENEVIGIPTKQDWQLWINYRINSTRHCLESRVMCPKCRLYRYELSLPHARPVTSPAIADMFMGAVDDIVLTRLSGPPPPYLGMVCEPESRRVDEQNYFDIYENLDFFASNRRLRINRTRIPNQWIMLPPQSHVYLGLKNYMIQDVMYEFVLDPDIPRSVARRVFLGIHAADRQKLLRPPTPPKHLSADDVWMSHRMLECNPEYENMMKNASRQVEQRYNTPKARDNAAWISRFLSRGRPVQSPDTYSPENEHYSSEPSAWDPTLSPSDPAISTPLVSPYCGPQPQSGAMSPPQRCATSPSATNDAIPPLPITNYMKTTIIDHYQNNYSALKIMYFFVAAIEAMFYLNFDIHPDVDKLPTSSSAESLTTHKDVESESEPAGDRPVGVLPRKLLDQNGAAFPDDFYGSLRKRHQMTRAVVENICKDQYLPLLSEPSFKVPSGFVTFDIPQVNIEHALQHRKSQQDQRKKIITHDVRVNYFEQCLPLWNSPLSSTTVEPERDNSAIRSGKVSPFYGGHPLLLPLATAYSVSALEPPE